MGRFVVIKVNDVVDVYETASDARLFAGAVRVYEFFLWAWFADAGC